jgi:large subunit ribosomal protein L9
VKIVLREDVENLGRKGDLLEVADGYARNYLVPRGLALRASKGIVKQAEAMRRSREAREVRDRGAAEELAARLSGARVEIKARAGEGGKLFGSVTSSDVADAVLAQHGVEIDRRKIDLDEPLKDVGAVEVTVRLHPDVSATIPVEVVAEAG